MRNTLQECCVLKRNRRQSAQAISQETEAQIFMSKTPLGIGIGVAFVVAACGWAMQNHKDGGVAGIGSARAEATAKLTPSRDEDKIAEYTAQFLAVDHYLKDLPKTVVSERTSTEYLNDLDPRHMYLLQSDVDAFLKNRD